MHTMFPFPLQACVESDAALNVTPATRAAMLLATRVANGLSSMQEYSLQQVYTVLLNGPASFSSTSYINLHTTSAIEYVKYHRNEAATELLGADGTEDGDGADNDNCPSDASDELDPDSDPDALPPHKDKHTARVPGQGVVRIYKCGTEFIPVSFETLYSTRGQELADMTYFEYTGIVRCIPMPTRMKAATGGAEGSDGAAGADGVESQDEQPAASEETPAVGRRGRVGAACFLYVGDNPLIDTHCQQLRTKQLTPIWLGAPCPKLPPTPHAESTRVELAAADEFAAHLLTLFQPWAEGQHGPPSFTYADLGDYMRLLEHGDGTTPATFVGRCRSQIIHNYVYARLTNARHVWAAAEYRCRSADFLSTVATKASRALTEEERAAVAIVKSMADDGIGTAKQQKTFSNSMWDAKLACKHLVRTFEASSSTPVVPRSTPSTVLAIRTSATDINKLVDGLKAFRLPLPGSTEQLPAPVPPSRDSRPQGAAHTDSESTEAVPDALAGLNTQQLLFATTLTTYLTATQLHKVNASNPRPEPLRIVLHGELKFFVVAHSLSVHQFVKRVCRVCCSYG